jgi:uncharacterized delta-60 repeat protein
MKGRGRRLAAAVVLVVATTTLVSAATAAPGDLDPGFGSDGRVTTDFGGSEGAQAVALQADGKIVAVGSGAGDFALARYNPDGSLDSGFGSGGRVTTDFGGFDAASAVVIEAAGKIVAAGRGGSGDLALARYNPDGASTRASGAAAR